MLVAMHIEIMEATALEKCARNLLRLLRADTVGATTCMKY